MAKYKIAIRITQVHGAPLTPSEILTLRTGILIHPGTVTIRLESRLPHLHEIIAVIYVSLSIVRAYARTSGYAAIRED